MISRRALKASAVDVSEFLLCANNLTGLQEADLSGHASMVADFFEPTNASCFGQSLVGFVDT